MKFQILKPPVTETFSKITGELYFGDKNLPLRPKYDLRLCESSLEELQSFPFKGNRKNGVSSLRSLRIVLVLYYIDNPFPQYVKLICIKRYLPLVPTFEFKGRIPASNEKGYVDADGWLTFDAIEVRNYDE